MWVDGWALASSDECWMEGTQHPSHRPNNSHRSTAAEGWLAGARGSECCARQSREVWDATAERVEVVIAGPME